MIDPPLVGVRDIYVNGGKKYPYCSGSICSHNILYKILTELNNGNKSCKAKYKCLDYKKIGSINMDDVQALDDASCKLLDAEEEIPQLGVLQNPDSDDDQSGIFWIDVREGSSMCNVTGLTMASFDIRVVLICSISILIGVILIVVFVILWCYRKKQRNADMELQ